MLGDLKPENIIDFLEPSFRFFDDNLNEKKYLIAELLLKLPFEFVEKIAEKCMFVLKEAGAEFIPNKYLAKKDLICFSVESARSRNKFKFIVLHELAHFYLKHDFYFDEKKDITRELSADKLVLNWQKKYFRNKDLMIRKKWLYKSNDYLMKKLEHE